MQLDPLSSAHLRVAPRRHGLWRRGAVLAIQRAVSLCGGRGFYRRWYLASGRFRVRHEFVRVPDLSDGLVGFRIAHISDLHAGSFLHGTDLRDVVGAIAELEPDLCVITGDFITNHWSEALLLLPDLGRLRARFGVYGVFGNHDYRGREEARIAQAFAEVGIRVLRNECVRFDTGGGTLALIGVEDLEESRVIDLEAARAELREGDLEIVLCHNPRGAQHLSRAGCVAILSGHTHGSQIDLPLARRAGPPHPGARMQVGSTRLIVNRGLGVIGVPLRVRAPAEVVVVRLERAIPDAR